MPDIDIKSSTFDIKVAFKDLAFSITKVDWSYLLKGFGNKSTFNVSNFYISPNDFKRLDPPAELVRLLNGRPIDISSQSHSSIELRKFNRSAFNIEAVGLGAFNATADAALDVGSIWMRPARNYLPYSMPMSYFYGLDFSRQEWVKVLFQKISFSYTDMGLTDAIIKMLAEEQGVTPREYRRQLVAAMDLFQQYTGSRAFYSQLRSAVTRFLDNPGYFSLAFLSDTGFSMPELIEYMVADQTEADLSNIKYEIATP